MSYKAVVKTYFVSLIVFMLFSLIVIWVSDPYMLFHKHWFYKGNIYNNFRIQNYGLVKYGNFDSIIIGTSMLENTSAIEASEKLGGKFANLSISGGSLYERFEILNFALKEKNIKQVIMSFDYALGEAKKINETFNPKLYSQNSLLEKMKIYLTDKALGCVFFNYKCDFIEYDLNRPNAWFDEDKHNRRFGGFDKWLKYASEDDQIQGAFTELLTKINKNYIAGYNKQYKKIIDSEILPLLRHSKTTFSIIIPPYNALWWAPKKYFISEMMQPYIYLLQKTSKMKNVKIYWFYDENYVFEVENYKDLSHYHYSINSKQIDAIKNGSNVLTLENYEEKMADFICKINEFNLQMYVDKISQVEKE